ncbi:pseudouridine synthase [Halieaceae bacterium IMCC14734]|uniref:Pseudouridine synthase n=1 Tax=Candidatus Litorirhabdus singularis TaxID=2518993 RepID=A0ABT3TG11_9GAMM|nr:pseudouridine synthase [Candidatus Litorirhabdus singularis]
MSARLYLFNKPYLVLSQFRDSEGRETLATYLEDPDIRVAGRLDYDSEGLLLLTDDGQLAQQITNPRHKTWKRYLVQVEGEPTPASLAMLRAGVALKDGYTRPAKVELLAKAPELWQREPPIRKRMNQPTSWLRLQIMEGRNRQVRRMCAAVGYPVLRLVRERIGDWQLEDMQPGEFRILPVNMPKRPTGKRG